MRTVSQVSELNKPIAHLTRAQMYLFCKAFGRKGVVSKGAKR
ncbi:hypothetical protein [Vibrio sp. S9_S30]|nr:hypothetical protein [Vibrio sp. S9_S30]